MIERLWESRLVLCIIQLLHKRYRLLLIWRQLELNIILLLVELRHSYCHKRIMILTYLPTPAALAILCIVLLVVGIVWNVHGFIRVSINPSVGVGASTRIFV